MSPRLRLCCFALVVAASLSVAPALTAQEAPAGWRLWSALGFGGGGSADGDGLALVGQLVFQRSPHHLALRATGIGEPYDPASCPMGDVGLLYGRTATGPVGHATIASGFALTDADGCDATAGGQPLTLGVPIVAEVALRLLPFMGVGLQAFANLNSRGSFGGVVAFLQLGWLPP